MLGKRDFKSTSMAGGKTSKRYDVDKELPACDSYEVCEDRSGGFYTKYLMKTELGKNQNKFYVLQLLKNIKSDKRYLWIRYGRVADAKGQTALKELPMANAERDFSKKLKEKTAVSKGYIEIEFKLGKVDTNAEATIGGAFAAK